MSTRDTSAHQGARGPQRSMTRHSWRWRRARARLRHSRPLRPWRWPRYLLLTLAAAPVAAALLAGAAGYRYYTDLKARLQTPDASALSALANYGGAQIYDRHGTLLYRFPNAAGGIQLPVRLADVSPALVAATVSTEDASFWTNPGIDFRATLHAAMDNIRQSGGPFTGRGGSGITQQLAKLALLAPHERHDRSPERKLREALYALEIDRRYSKEQILEWYLNVVNYGGMYDGIESAAQGYFGVPAKDLDMAQAAMLAGIPQSPSQNSPYLHPLAAKQRQAAVLDLMVRHGVVTPEQASAAAAQPLHVQQLDESLPLRAPWFVEFVRQELIQRFGEHCFQTCGLSVTTTLDMPLQEQASAILERHLATYGDPVGVHNGSLVSMYAQTGEILVMVGSRSYDDPTPAIQGGNNFATAVLQPGSAFKPFVYLSLFMARGYGPDSIIWDAPFVTPDGYRCENPPIVGRTVGPIPVRVALGNSLNCAANRAAAAAGVKTVIDTARAVGVTTLGDPGQYGPSIATGGANITLVDLAYAYSTLARAGTMIGTPSLSSTSDGMRVLDPASILEVRDASGRERFRYAPQSKQVVPAGDAYLVTNIISDCKNRSLIWGCDFPAFQLFDGRPVAVKTGTQQAPALDRTLANWQFMYTPEVVTGGWVGNADRSTWTDRNGGANAVGFSVRDLQNAVLKAYEVPATPFARPPDVVSVPVRVFDRSRGPIVGCGAVQQGLFARGSQPDVNNRICVNGRVQVPPEQLGTGGLGPYFPDPPLVTVGTAAFVSPAVRAVVSGVVAVVVRPPASGARASSYRIEWGAGASPASWITLPGMQQLGGGLVLASWDVSALPAGEYSLRVVHVDLAGLAQAGQPMAYEQVAYEQVIAYQTVQVGQAGERAAPVATPPPVATPTPVATPSRGSSRTAGR